MNAEAFTLKARRTTRVPLRVPVQLGIEEGGAARTLDGWTVIVNIHGAKIESKRKMQVNEKVKVTVPITRKTQSGLVVWSSEVPSAAGNFEFAIELTEPGNLWGVGFPPSDWKELKRAAGPVGLETISDSTMAGLAKAEPPSRQELTPELPAKLELEDMQSPPATLAAAAAAVVAIEANAEQQAAPAPSTPPVKKIAVAGYQPQPIAPFVIAKSDAPVDAADLPVVTSPAALSNLSTPTPPAESPAAGAEQIDPAPAAGPEAPATPLPEMPMVAEMFIPVPMDEPVGHAVDSALGAAGALGGDLLDELEQFMNNGRGESAAQPAPLPMEQLFTGSAEPVPVSAEASSGREAMPAQQRGADLPEAAVCHSGLPAEMVLETPAPASALEATDGGSPVEEAQLLEIPLSAPASIPALEAVPEIESAPAPAAAVLNEKTLTRLSEAAEAALLAKAEAIFHRSSAELEVRLSELETAALKRLDENLARTEQEHHARYQQRAEKVSSERRAEFEQTFIRLADEKAAAARTRHEEMVSRADQDLRRRAQEISLYAQGQVQKYSAETLEVAQSNMAAQLQDLLPAVERAQSQALETIAKTRAALETQLEAVAPEIEKQVTEQSRKQAEQTLYLLRGQFEAMLSSRVEEARAYWQDQMVSMQQETASRVNSTMEQCVEQQSKLMLQQMDRAMTQMAAQVQRTFFKHIVEELTSQQKMWLTQTRRNMENLADRGIQQVRQQMVQLLGAMGAALVQDGLPEGPAESYIEDAQRISMNA